MDDDGKHQQLAAVVTEAINDDETYHYQLITHSQSLVEIKPDSHEVREKIFEQLTQVTSLNAQLVDPLIHKKFLIKGTIETQSEEYISNWIKREHSKYGGNGTPEVNIIHTANGPYQGISNVLISTDSSTIYERVRATSHIRIGPSQYHIEVWHGPLRQCTNCQHLFHNQRNCTRRTACEHCGNGHHISDCADRSSRDAARCINCPPGHNNHGSGWHRCPTQSKIRRPIRR